MAITHVLLGLLSAGDGHGYELKRRYDRRFAAARPLALAQVYNALDRLRQRELVAPAGTAKAGAAERSTFRITAPGRAELDRWLHEVEAPAPHADNALQVKVTLALVAADEQVAEQYLLAQRAAHLTRMREYARVTSDPQAALSEVLAADYALTHLEADLNWIETTRTRVHQLAEELADETQV